MRAGSIPGPSCCLRILAIVAFAIGFVRAAVASPSTWTRERTTPSVTELVSVDATGEPGWPYGQEDLAGDGLAAFTQAEQAIDWRTVYAATDPRRLWVRAYVVNTRVVAPWSMLYVFVNSDGDTGTGGNSVAPEIDRGLTSDEMAGGGYEHVLAIRGDGNQVALWTYDPIHSVYSESRPSSEAIAAKAGRDIDPILGGGEHGYVQVMVNRDLVQLADERHALLFVRSTSGISGDRAVGRPAPCLRTEAQSAQPRESAPSSVSSASRLERPFSNKPAAAALGLGLGLGAVLGVFISRRYRFARSPMNRNVRFASVPARARPSVRPPEPAKNQV